MLRPGNSPARRGAIGQLPWLLRKLRQAFPRATLRVRLDGGFAGLIATADVLFQTLQQRAQGTTGAGAQVRTRRDRLIKLAVWVTRSARRIVLHLPRAFPWLGPWCQLARAVGALPG